MADEKENKKPEEKETTDNVVLAKFKKDQAKEDRRKKWRVVEEAVSAARQAYCGSWDNNKDEKLVSFDTALKDLIEVLNKVAEGEIKLGGLGENEGGIELPQSAEA
ncbi:MAG: hypothetical protein CH104c_0501 [Candidatus Woesebacteria bacterium]|nr:MAG: hypothetical protein CH104c_0501 [Candidatus Woesebacteria bacterium]